jgi:hypothetical protein
MGERQLLSLLRGHRMKKLLQRMLSEAEFLSPYGIRSLSRAHAAEPFRLRLNGDSYGVSYEPGESHTTLFGGNSNWRGPIWMPINFLLIEALYRFDSYYGPDFIVECPVGSGTMMSLADVASGLADRIVKLFLRGSDGIRPALRGAGLPHSPESEDPVLFHEYFHGETGQGLGASHQTGWTALVAILIQELARQRKPSTPE